MKKLVLFAAILFSTTLFSCGRATTTEGADVDSVKNDTTVVDSILMGDSSDMVNVVVDSVQ